MGQARATLLLPAARRLGVPRLSPALAKALGRADVVAGLDAGRRAQLLRTFRLLPAHWPVAALTRQVDAGDAGGAAWLRADPCRVQPDMSGARLLGIGARLGLVDEDARQLLPALKPLFGDAGFPIDAPVPSRWYLRLPREAKLPAFSDPDEALGADVFDHLPGEGSEGRRWRALLSEVQVVLHNHPWNAHRQARGMPAVNSLWFWGGGVLPDHVQTTHSRIHSDDEVGGALAHAVGVHAPLPDRFAAGEGDAAWDLTGLRDPAVFERDWLAPAIDAVADGHLRELVCDLEDGARFTFTRGQRWRIWRRPRAGFDA